MKDPILLDHLLAILLGVVLPVAAMSGQFKTAHEEHFSTSDRVTLYWTNSLALWVAALLVVALWVFTGRSTAGLGPGAAKGTHAALGIGLAVVGLLLFLADSAWQLWTPERRDRARRDWRERTPFVPVTALELGHSMVLVVSAAVCEEVVFRGYLITYLRYWTGDSPVGLSIAVALPAIVFGVAHLYQGTEATLKITGMAALLGAVFVLTGSLWAPIALHLVLDLVGMLLAVRLLHVD